MGKPRREPQHGKSKKRGSSWHGGSGQADEWERTMERWPEEALTNADPTAAAPERVLRGRRKRFDPSRRMGAK
jgi:hypothetical protein